jgi:hemolysin type calcium-binding protein
MTWIRLALLTVLVLLCLGAAPAHATLLVRSDGNGLFVMDKNGLNDEVDIQPGTKDGTTGYDIVNRNLGDVFKFDRQVGCEPYSGIVNVVFCHRNGPKINVQLSSGNDSLRMNHEAQTCGGGPCPALPPGEASVAAGSGNDVVRGHPGKDQLHGQTGEDELKGLAGNDFLDGGDNSDRLEGGDGNDTLEGEDGSDVLLGGLGADILRGNPGNDFINAKEPSGSGVADEIGCGGNFDTLEADLKDVIPASCEQVEQSPVGETPHVKILGKTLRVAPSGEVRVRMRCPRGVKKLGCKGSLQLRLDRKRGSQASRSRKVRYRIKAGRRKTVKLRLTAKDVRTLRKRQRRKLKARGILTSVEKGKKGRKTTVRNPRLKLRGG